MKIRSSFVTNSSSSSFVVDVSIMREDIKEMYKKNILDICSQVTIEQMMEMRDEIGFDDTWYLVNYEGGDIFDIYVTHDSVLDCGIMGEIYERCYTDIKPKFLGRYGNYCEN